MAMKRDDDNARVVPFLRAPVVRRLGSLALVGALAISVAGCFRMGPTLVVRDHVEYATAVGDSWKSEALTNIVRLRYADWPVFTKIETAVTNYTLQHQLVAGGVMRSPFGGKDNLQAFYTGKISESPKAILTPLGGPMFVQSLLTPIPSSVLLSLLQSSGWSADRVLETMLHAVNGRRNLHVVWEDGWKLQIDPRFTAFTNGLQAAQRERALSIQRTGRGRQASMLICVRTERLSEQSLATWNDVRESLGMSPDTDCYTVVAGNRSPEPGVLAIQTRSVLALMVSLGAYVDVPDVDLASGVAPDIGALAPSAARFLRIHSGPNLPPKPHTAIQYRDHWFWIDHTDADSKRTFAYLALLMNLAEAGSSGGAQLVLNVGQQVPGIAESDAAVDETIRDLEADSEDDG
jgi:hypothetical protein